MYSLYRAWLSMSQVSELQSSSASSPQPLNLSGPVFSAISPSASGSTSNTVNTPDVQLQVGPSLTNFSAHRNVLSTHSGFFKAALNNFPTTNSSSPIGPILVPNIAVDEFSSLLTFMYTGYLDLNLSNIYNILLATHILHMPRALELCRNFLMQTQQQQQQQQMEFECPMTSSTIIKPIASRKPLPNIEDLQSSNDQITNEENNQNQKKIFNNSVFKIYSSTNSEIAQQKSKSDDQPSTSSSKQTETNEVTQSLVVPKSTKNKKRRMSSLVAQPACALTDDSNRVIVDIACCDGPVRFHRVVNKNYGRSKAFGLNETNAALATEDEDPNHNKKRTTLAAINKIMTENIKMANTIDDDNNKDDNGENNASSSQSVDLYTCQYCNHTFKSQYCYQKHARRHLNPVEPVKTTEVSISGDRKQSTSNPCSSNAAAAANATKREFKLLDMNVQYYPCKTCGSKFPSYYFVHKHRKLCHADEMADGSNKNNEIVQVKPKMGAKKLTESEINEETNENVSRLDVDINTHDETTNSDIIDVEETN